MKKSVGIVLTSLATIISACGTNKPAGQKAPAGARGETGSKGDRGPMGPGNAFPYQVTDGNGAGIGDATWDGFSKFNQGTVFSFESLDGAIFTVNPTTGFYAGTAYCLYAANDCTGTCLNPVSPGSSNILVMGRTSLFWLRSPTTRTLQSYASYSIDSGSGGTSCGVAGGPSQEWLVAVPDAWVKPQGFVYPIPVPLKLEKAL